MDGGKLNPRKELRSSPPSLLERFRSKLREAGPMTTEEIVGFYEELLVELTSNSKPIITDLSIIAGEQKEHGEGIAGAICERILKVPMEHKLPSLYLLDSIVKNIGHEYVRHFSARLPEVFCETYKKVNSSLRPAMRHLFKTWPPYFPSSVVCKIEDKLEFSPQENQKPAGSANVKHSESQPLRPSHGIHVNPKYLEACGQSEHSAVIQESDTGNNAEKADLGGERMEKNASACPQGWSGASSKFHDAQHGRVPSSLQSYRQKSSFQFGEYDFDHLELLPPCSGFERVGTTAVDGVEGPLPHSRTSSPRMGKRRSISPPGDSFQIDTFPERVVDRASLSNSGLGFGSGRDSDQSGRLSRSWPSGDGAQNPEASSAYNLNNGCDKLRARLLIDAYGGKDTSHGKLLKIQRLDVNDVRSDMATRNLQSAEEEYVWENMSPTLANQSRGYNQTPFGPDTGLSRPKAALLGNEFRWGDWPCQAPLPRADDPANVNEDVNPVLGSGHRSFNNKYQDDIGNRKEPWLHYQSSHHAQEPLKFSNDFPQSSQQNLSPRSQGRILQMPLSASGISPTIGQKMPSPFDDAQQAEVPFQRLSSNHPDPLDVETSGLEKHLAHGPHSPHAASVIWPPLHKSQPLPLLPIPPQQQQFRNLFDLEPNKPIVNPGPYPPLILPRQQFDTSDRKTINSLPYQQSGFNLNQQSLEQSTNLQIQSHEAHGSFVPPVPAQLPSHIVPQTLNHVQAQGAVVVPILPNLLSGISPPLPPCPHPPLLHPPPAAPISHSPPPATQNLSATSMLTPAGPLPPLPPGPPPASSQMKPASQNAGTVISDLPASAYSGLIGSLMAQGLISLMPPIPSQDAVGVEFNAEHLKVRHESSVNALYGDLSRQCTTCGLRFKSQEEHSSHMDWHVTKNRIAKTHKQKPSRNWFVSAKEWLSGAETLGTDVVPGFFPMEAVAEKTEDREVAVPADENQNICALCGEPFEDFYSDETEEWMYKGAVYLNLPGGSIEFLERSQLGPIVHAKCRPESTDGSGKT